MKPEHIFFIGAHPDDMIGCAALALKLHQCFADRFALHVADYTRGENGMGSAVSMNDAAAIRTREEQAACAMLEIEPIFLGERNDHRACAGREICEATAEIFRRAPPRAVITHWPLDTHPDHVMCYAATVRALDFADCRPEMYFFEESIQTRSMPVRFYLPFDAAMMRCKAEFIRRYASQNADDNLVERKTVEARYHGWQCGTPFAEPYGAALPKCAGLTTLFDELR